MPSEEVPRKELICLLQGDEQEPQGWRITYSALVEGRRLQLPGASGSLCPATLCPGPIAG